MSGDEEAEAWAQVARERGLSLEAASTSGTPPLPRLRGFLDGYRVEMRGVEHAPVTSRGGFRAPFPGETSTAGVEARCMLLPPMATGLVARTTPALGGPRAIDRLDLGEREDVQIGDEQLDAALEIRGEPRHILPLFTAQIRGMLHVLLDHGYGLALLDTGVSLTRSIHPMDAATLNDALTRAVQATLLLDLARQARDVASFRLSSEMHSGLALNAYPVWVGRNHWATEVFVRFAAPLGLGLFVRPATDNDAAGALFAAQDLVLGDPAFDQPFIVQSWAGTPTVAAVLDADARREVLALRDRVGLVHVRDDGVAVRANYVLSRTEEVWTLAHALVPLATRLMANAKRRAVLSSSAP